MLTKIGSIGFHSKEVMYHHECKRDYFNRARTAALKLESKSQEHVAHENAFTYLVSYIQSSVIESNHPEF